MINKANKNFTHLHVHSAEGSLLDSILKVEDIVKFAKDNNQNAIALTDHGKMYAYVDFWKECNKNGIKPIIGCEMYEVESLDKAMELKDSTAKGKGKLNRYHLVLLAKNKVGFNNLIKIVSDSHLKFHYTKPLIDIDYIQKNNLGEGIVCTTACYAGRLNKTLLNKEIEEEERYKLALDYVEQLEQTFDYVSLEIQSHNTKDQIESNTEILKFAKKYNKDFHITCDAHMLTEDKALSHEVFIYIGMDREVGESYEGCWLQKYDDVIDYMSNSIDIEDLELALENTNKIADMIEEYSIGVDSGVHMPKAEIPKNFKDNLEYYDYLIKKGFEEKGHHLLSEEEQKARWDRINKEREVLIYLDYIDYFLDLKVMIDEFRKRDIPINYSRGSGANCIHLFYLGVTQIDSYRWNLDFSRFANKGRLGSIAD